MCNNKIISENCFNELMRDNKILCISIIKEIIFIENDKVYKIISHNNELYLEYDNTISFDLPDNLILAEEKSLVKTRKNVNI